MNPLVGNPLTTRADIAEALLSLWRPLRRHASRGGARLSLSNWGAHFSPVAAELEGFARPLWGIAPTLAGGIGFPDTDLILSGLANGSNPAHEEYWGPIGNRDQRCVEAAAIAFALMVAPQQLWEPLPQSAKDNLAAWLGGALEVEVPPNNWNFFVVLAASALKQFGYPVEDQSLAKALAKIESYWVGDGWYHDGDNNRADHYIGFAMHFYGLIFARLRGESDPERAATFRARAGRFAEDFRHWFADDGAVIPFGRSMTYRFACGSFWGALAFASEMSLTDPKPIWLNHLRWWRDHAEFDRDGVMPIGWSYPNPLMSEPYNSAQSPYWAFKAFLPLALPESDPFWSQAGQAQTRLAGTSVQPKAGFVLMGEQGQATALAAGQSHDAWMRHIPEKYGKFAYSSRYGFSIEAERRDFPNAAFDNMLVFSRDGKSFEGRAGSDETRFENGRIYSRWRPTSGVEVETWIVPFPPGHVRVHIVRTGSRWQIGEAGFAIPFGEGAQHVDIGLASVESPGEFAGIRSFDDANRAGSVLKAQPNTNLIVPRTWVPQLRGEIERGETRLVTLVVASPNLDAARACLAADPTTIAGVLP